MRFDRVDGLLLGLANGLLQALTLTLTLTIMSSGKINCLSVRKHGS